jgi:putative nucleotidyltransferase with HDIG domain
MLKRITIDRLAVGMYITEFCGSWIDHPFWRAKFVVASEADLRRIAGASVRELVIDTERGLDLPANSADAARRHADAAAASVQLRRDVEQTLELAVSRPTPAPAEQVDFSAEVRRAAALCKRSMAEVTTLFADARLGRALDLQGCLPLVGEISESVFRNAGALISVARLKTRDEYTFMHSVAVCALMVALARQLGCGPEATREAGLAGLLHDIGKARMPLDILNKPGKLSDGEYALMRTHPERGHALLGEIGILAASARDVCLHHHERIDGTGYPERLQGDAISQLARMGAVCDVYDALTSNRAYKAAWDPAEALRQMAQWSGHFDPVVFQAFVKTVGIYPIGSLVRLKSGRLAVVVEQHPQALLRPSVRIFYSTKSNERLMPQVLDLAAGSTRDLIVGCEAPADWPFKDLEQLAAPPHG